MKALLAAALLCLLPGLAFAAPDLPPALKASGTLKVAVTPNYPPLEFRDPATNALTGFDVALAEALAAKLGVRLEWQESGFEAMLPALQTGRVDAIVSGMSDLASRHEASSFVDYLRSGPQFFVQQSRAGEFDDMAALCGRKVGTSRRTSFPSEVAAWSASHCGDKPITVVGTEGSGDARLQLKQGRIDAAVQGSETLPYVMGQEPGAYAPVGAAFGTQYTGIAVARTDPAMRDALAGALDALIADGSYRALLDKWQLSADGVEKATVDAGQ